MYNMEEMLKAFDKLSIDFKRNEISNELLFISELLSDSLEQLNAQSDYKTAKNYNPNKDSNKNESDMLTYFYEDIFRIRNEITLLNLMIKSKQN